MPRTAPTVGGTPAYVSVSFGFIDANGTLSSTAYTTTAARATNANVEAMAVALGAASNANLYSVNIQNIYDDVASKAAVTDALRESARDFISTLVREPVSRKTQEILIPAPLEAMFFAGENNVDVGNTIYQAVNTAADAMLVAAYQFVSVRFTQRRETNQRTRF